MILHSLHTGIDILAQIELTPEAPPKSDGFLRLGRWLSWFVLLAGVCALVYGGGKFGWVQRRGTGIAEDHCRCPDRRCHRHQRRHHHDQRRRMSVHR